MQQIPTSEVDAIRSASRMIVRELGFMNAHLADTDLSASGVHAIIEIGARPAISAKDLALLLRLEKSTVSRLIKNLIQRGLVRTEPSASDARQHDLHLTGEGRRVFRQIEAFGRNQVRSALDALPSKARGVIRDGLSAYADALAVRGDSETSDLNTNIELIEGYTPALLGRVTEMHARFYARHHGFGPVFERKVAGEMAGFLGRIDRPCNAVWSVHMGNELVGSVSIDGDDLEEGQAHLRWFIVDERVQGCGAGHMLISAAMDFVDRQGFDETHLWTFKGLNAARRLYERAGFTLVEERPGARWGTEVLEQRFVRPAHA